MPLPDTAALERAARLLDAHPDYRITRALPALDQLPLPAPEGKTRTALIVDTETTSLDPHTGKIIQIAACAVTFDARARIVAVGQTKGWTEDPGEPLSEEIARLTGLSDADLAGTRINDAAVERLIADASLIVAHNSQFDRPWWEARFPLAAAKPWACSLREIDWRDHGQDNRSLGVLLDRVAGWFNARHRADSDVDALVALLTTTLPSGRTAFAEMLFTAARPTVRISATRAPFEAKEALRARGYRWQPSARVWRTETAEDRRDAEIAWLAAEAGCPSPTTQRVTWFERHRCPPPSRPIPDAKPPDMPANPRRRLS